MNFLIVINLRQKCHILTSGSPSSKPHKRPPTSEKFQTMTKTQPNRPIHPIQITTTRTLLNLTMPPSLPPLPPLSSLPLPPPPLPLPPHPPHILSLTWNSSSLDILKRRRISKKRPVS